MFLSLFSAKHINICAMPKAMPKIYIENYGCSANKSNAEIMAGLLERSGCIVVSDEKAAKDADIVIINSCIVKGPTENKILKRIKELAYSGKNLIVSGCMPEAENDLIHDAAPDAILLGPQHVRDVTKAVDLIISGKEVRTKIKDFIGEQHEIKLCLPKHRYNHVIDIVQISEGCDEYCTYCITKLAKGKLFSYPSENIIAEVNMALKEGCKEIWLTSQDCASYQHGLPDLLQNISQLKGKFFVRVGMMNPNNVLPMLNELIDAFKEEKIFKFIHIPVQSGNDEILKKMGRRYKAEDFKRIIEKFRREIPKITVSTDIICGFPTETKEQFQDSVKLIEEIKPDVLNISRFWPRPGTPAEKMEQLSGGETKNRSTELAEIFGKIALEKNKRWVGWKGKVLIDEKGKPGTDSWIGRNYCYKPVVVKSQCKLGDFADVEIKDATNNDLRG